MKKAQAKEKIQKGVRLGERLIQGMTRYRDALRSGKDLGETFTVRHVTLDLEPREYEPADVQKVREQLRVSQGVFAKLLGVSVKTVQAWEQGCNPAPPMARRLLEIIEEDPGPWQKLVRSKAEVSA